MNICVISWDFPDSKRSAFAFVKQLVDEFVAQGHRVCVIAPYSITSNRGTYKTREDVCQNLTILRPNYISLSSFTRFNAVTHKHAVIRALKKMPFVPDAIYGHFWLSVYEALGYSRKHNIPLFVATGESSVDRLFPARYRKKQLADYIRGAICVSTKNKDESVQLGLISEDKCEVFPNAVNTSLFHKMDKEECRKELGFPNDAFIVGFVGGLIERKGPERVSAAIKQLTGKMVYSLFVGKGDQTPDCNNILFIGALPHSQIPRYLNAADVFVLPTLQEGCCNAVVEAMACGLPIISSNRSFNWDVLNDSNSIMIDPTNVDEIAGAIQRLRDDEETRAMLSKGSLEKAKSLTIEKRAEAIIGFMNSRV
jgi:glycosyltransferase involved in cell wall biosynthesis